MLSRLENRVPVAAVDRGKSVLVAKDMSFSVADHDFTKVKVIPSVSLQCDMPEDIGGSFYSGNVTVCLKEAAFSPSSPLRHATELLQTLREKKVNSVLKPVLLLYTDGGPDHRVGSSRWKVAERKICRQADRSSVAMISLTITPNLL